MFDTATRQVDIVLPLETEVTPVIEAGGEFLKLRQTTTALLAAMLLAFAAATAQAGAGAVCKSNSKGDVSHTGTDGSMCDASADTGGKSKAIAKGDSFAEATSDSHGKANATATGGASAQAAAFGNPGTCKASAKAMGSSPTMAFAQCEAGGFAHATATNGGNAQAFDDKAPTCDPGTAGGTAIVHSSFGNCP
jgi:hypothetical protein